MLLYFELLYVLPIPWILYRVIVFAFKRKFHLKTEIIKALFYFSLVFIYSLTLFPFPFYLSPHLEGNGYLAINLIPFKSMYGSLTHFYYMVPIRNIGGNILLFIPLGFSLPLRFHIKNIWKVLVIGFSISLLVEITQLLSGSRSFDVDDLILNTLGTVIGYIGYRLFLKVATWLVNTYKKNK